MNIWVIGRGIPTEYNQMLGSFELEQAEMIAKKHNVSYLSQIFSFNPRKGTPGYIFSETETHGIKVYGRTSPYFPGRLGIRLDSYKNMQWKLFTKKVEERTGTPDIIHLHYPTLLGLPDIISEYKMKGVKIVCTEHWTHVLNKSLDQYELKNLAWFDKNSDAFICVGDPLRKSVTELVGATKGIYVVPNIINECFYPDFNCNNEKYTFITVSRLVPVKQVDKVVDAFYQITRFKDNVRLIIVGDGEERTNIENKVQQYQIANMVEFTGTLTREDVAEKVRTADCLVCFSNLETFGVPIIEAWASGIPVIASNALGFSEYWKDGLGYIVDQNDVKQLESCMLKMIDSKFDKSYLSKYAKDAFGEGTIMKKLDDIYTAITENQI